jgi:transcription elongation factor Elf1
MENVVMIKSQSATRSTPLSVQRFGRSFCPECNDMLLAPAASEFVSESLIRHFWSCDTCGHEFETSVKLPSFHMRRDKALS